MSHACPDCDQECYCGGDIDDCRVYENFPGCTHCLGKESDDDEQWDPIIEDMEATHERE